MNTFQYEVDVKNIHLSDVNKLCKNLITNDVIHEMKYHGSNTTRTHFYIVFYFKNKEDAIQFKMEIT